MVRPVPRQPHAQDDPDHSLHRRLDARWWNRFWPSMWIAVGIHFVVFTWSPALSVHTPDVEANVLEVVETLTEVDIPPPPAAIPRPAIPTMGSATVSEDLTIATTTFEEFDASERMPPPPPAEATGSPTGPRFVPHEVAPVLTNRREMLDLLADNYPKLLKDAGIGGTVLVWVFVGTGGEVLGKQVHTTSTYDALDEAALLVASHMRFSPAMNRDQPVQVWVAMPINFTVNDGP
jgi:TonB family protein